jgi:hypothetical protein
MQFKRKFGNPKEMKNRLQNLIETLQKYELAKASLSEVAKEFVRFFEELSNEAEKVTPEKKEEFATQFVDIIHQLVAVINPYIDLIPLGEENLLSSLDNPNYFDADQWKSAQEAKEHLGEIACRLLPHLSTAPRLEGTQESLKEDQKKQPPRAPKSKWMKS